MPTPSRDRLRRRSPRPTRGPLRFAPGPEALETRQLLDGGIALSKTTWVPLGPAPIVDEPSQTNGVLAASGRISAIAADPIDPKTIYIGAAGGGVWKTVDGGGHWLPLTDNLPTLQMGALAVAPSDPRTIYAGTGDANNDFAQQAAFLAPTDFTGRGLFKSTDAGATWSLVGGSTFDRYSITKLAVDPTDPNTLYVADGQPGIGNLSGNSGIWKSTDGGATFANTTASLGTSEWYTDVTIDPRNPQLLYSAIGTEHADINTFFPITGSAVNGVYKSTDGGTTWARAGDFPGGDTDGRIAIAQAPSDSNTLYAATVNLSTLGLKELDASTDGGATWVKQGNTPNFLGGQGEYDIAIGVDPADAKKVYVSGQFDYQNGKHIADVTTDGGATWFDLTTQNNNPHTDAHAITFDAAGKLLLGSDGGIWRLDDPSTSAPIWADLNTDLNTTEFYGVALDPTDINTVYGGLQDNGTVKFAGALGWHEVQGGDGGITRVDPFNHLTVYAEFPGSPDRSDDGGKTFTDISANIKGNGNFVEPLILDPGTANRVLVGTDQLNESTDKGANFAQISTPNQNGWTSSAAIDAIAVAPSAPMTLYASAGGKIFVTSNDGKSWADRSIPNAGDLIGEIQVDPADPGIAYAVRGAFDDANDRGHVFRTTDAGVTWADISGNLPDGGANSIAVDATQASRALYVGTNAGVYASYNLGQTWRVFKAGLPNVRVDEVEFNPTLNVLLAGTHGRGAWEVIPSRSDVVVSVNNLGTLTAGTPVTNILVGSFTDSDPATVDQYSAQVEWGDGTISAGTIAAGATAGTFTVRGSTTYVNAGDYTLTLAVSKVAGDLSQASGPVKVVDPPVAVTAQPFAGTEGVASTETVATFVDAATSGRPYGRYSAQVDWGDGTTSAASVVAGQGGADDVVGTHTYAGFGVYAVKVSVIDTGSGAVVVSSPASARIADQPLSPSGATITPTEGATFTSVVATYTDGNPLGTAAGVTASIHWGDGTPDTAGTVAPNAGGGFDILGTHAYPDALTYQITASITSDSGATVIVGSVAVVGIAQISGQPDNVTPQEGLSFTAPVATFTDPNRFLTAADFSAAVDWGDGTSDAEPVVAGVNGSFDVVGTHTYLVVGTYTTTVVIDSRRGATTTTVGKAFVQDAPLTASGVDISVVAGSTFDGVVATFVDANPFGTASQFTPTIDWGDGSATLGTVQADPAGGFEVLGSHVYHTFGSYAIATTIADIGGASSQANASATVVDAGITATPATISGVEGTPVPTRQVATFVDANPFAAAADFTALIAWGDGTTSAGNVLATPGGFRVLGNHTYSYFGTYAAGVTIRSAGGASASVTTTETIADAPLTAAGLNLSLVEGATFGGLVAHFTDSNPSSRPSDFTATIAWGDGTTTAASISPESSGTTYDVSGSHAYHAGSYAIAVHVVSVGSSTADASGTATVADATVTSTGVAIKVVSGTPFNGVAATFQVDSPIAKASDYTATINWGDGSVPTAGTVTADAAGGFDVSGSHTYRTGTYVTTVTVAEGSNPRVVIAGTATVADAPIAATPATVSAAEGVPFSTILASFTDPDPAATRGSFTATVNWGDGTVDAGIIAPNPAGGYSVSGGHTYNTGAFALTVTIAHAGGASTTVGTTVSVPNSPLLVSARTVGGVAAAPTPASAPFVVATFVDADPRFHVASFYTATIDWGDGTTATGTVQADPAGGFDVLGSKAYAQFGTYATTVTVTDSGGGPHVGIGSIVVADAPITVKGTPQVQAVAGAPFSATLATFTDLRPNVDAGSFTAAINWGDGTATTPGTVADAPAGGFVVTGTHTYARFGSFTVKTSLASDGGSTAAAQGTATVADAPITAGNVAIAASAGVPFRGTLAHFDVADAAAPTSDYSATVNWGDGTSSAGTVVAAAGGFDVTSIHTYASPGSDPVTVTLNSLGGSTAAATGTATVSNAPIGTALAGIAPTATIPFTGTVAYLVDANRADLASRFTAAITWGDGTVDLARVVPIGAGAFALVGTHTYASAGTLPFAVDVVEAGGGSTSAAGSVVVATRVYPVTGALSPLSDSGVSNADGITNVRTPTYNGTAAPGSTVTVFALRSDAASASVVGIGIAGPTGAWSISLVPLLDGEYRVFAASTAPSGVANGAFTPLSGGNSLVVDTVGPSVVGAVLDPLTGRFTVTLQDNLGGLSTPSLLDPTHYGFSVINRSVPRTQAVNSVALAGGTGVGTAPEAVTLTVGGGRRLRNGAYILRLVTAGITDAAGNALVERFFNPFPGDPIGAGNDYVAKFGVSGRSATAPQQYISPAEIRAAARHRQQFQLKSTTKRR